MSDNRKSSATSKSEKCGPSASKMIEIGPTGESILQQVEQLDRLINASASTSAFQDVGQPQRLSTLQSHAPTLQRRLSAIASIQAIFDSPITPFPTPSDILQSEIRQYSADELSNGFSAANPPTSERENISVKNSRGRKVYPQDETAIHDSPKDSQQANEIRSEAPTTPPSVPSQAAPPLLIGRRRSNLSSFAEGGSGRRRSSVASSAECGSGRRSSVASLSEGAFGGRRGNYSSFAESVVSIAQSLSKVLHKSSNDETEEKRQAKIAELVDKEVVVFNAAQLAQIQQRNTHPFTISVNSPFRHWYDLIITLTTAHVMFSVPSKVGFSAHPSGMGFVLDVVVDVIFLLETTLNFSTSYEDDTTGEEIEDIVKIRQNCLYGWFAVDAISSFPCSIVGTRNGLLNFTKVKITQVYKMSNSGLVKAMSARINRSVDPSRLRMTMLTLVFFVSQRFIACAYFYINNNHTSTPAGGPTDEICASTLGKQYIDAFYFAIMVTIANDVNPITCIEKLFTALMLFVGVVVNADIIGSAANLLSNLDKAEIARENQMDSINEYLRFKKALFMLQDKIWRYYDYSLNTRLRDPTDNLFADLPDRLKLALKLNLYEVFIRKVPLFRVCSNAGVVAIVQCLKLVVAMPGEIIVRQGEVSGRVSISVQAVALETIPLGNLGEGSFFGEISLLTGEPQSAEVRAKPIAELVYLTQSDFAAATDKFPTFFLAVKRISNSRMQTANNLRKISKHSRYQLPISIQKGSLKQSVMSMTRRGSRAFGAEFKAIARTNTKRISTRLSNSRRKPPESFNALYVERLSLAQARQLSRIRAISDVIIENSDEDPTWND